MKLVRNAHLYLGCLFAPLIIYFCISGMWQLFRLNDLPKEGAISSTRIFLHEMSKPHAHSTAPGKDPKREQSDLFNCAAALMALGMVVSSILGIVLAFRYSRKPKLVLGVLCMGIALPILFLFVVSG
jgi:hypothetical protein